MTPKALLEEGVAQGVFPAARAVVFHRGEKALDVGAGAGPDARFDLASLTKICATTPLFMKAWGEGHVGPQTTLGRFFPGADPKVAALPLSDLLYHRSGLPAFVPFFERALQAHPALLEGGDRDVARAEVISAASRVPLERAPGAAAVYSDVGFILLGAALESVYSARLDRAFDAAIAKPHGLSLSFRPLSSPRDDGRDVLPTGDVRPRPPAPGQEGLWSSALPTRASPPGEVDDDNAWVMDGVSGHAGLFGRCEDVARFGQLVLEETAGKGALAPPFLWSRAVLRDPSVEGSTRALGFDTPSNEGASSGTYLGRIPPGAVGHLGFTGVSLWIDLGRALVVALCTNRVALGRQNVGIRAFRPRFHDAVVDSLGLL